MEIKLARFISWIIHPLFIPTFLILIILNIHSYSILIIPNQVRWILIALVFITTSVFPMTFIFFMKQRKMIRSLHMEAREDRTMPYAMAVVFDFTACYMISQIRIDEIFTLFLLGSAFVALTCLIINFYFKISIHMAGIGGMTGALLGIAMRLNTDLVLPVILSVLASGLVGFARLRLNAHNEHQVYTGFLFGFIIMLIILQW